MKPNTAEELYGYIEAKRSGKEYTGPLGEESKFLIERVGNDLDKLEKEAEAVHFLDNVLFS